MSKYKLGDIFIGDYPETQAFGVNPANYAKFGLKGHNGLDFGVPTGTQVVSSADGWVQEVGHDPNGYGNYVKVVHLGYLTIYAHLDHAVVNVNDKLIAGQLVGISDNTGNSTGAHLHFGVAPCDFNGIKTETNNGFSGYIDPNGDRCSWDIKNITQPTSANQAQPQAQEITDQTPIPLNITTATEEYGEVELQTLKAKITAKDQALNDYKRGQDIQNGMIEDLRKQLDDCKATSATVTYTIPTPIETPKPAIPSQPSLFDQLAALWQHLWKK